MRLISLKLAVSDFPLEAFRGLLLVHGAAKLLSLMSQPIDPGDDPFLRFHAAKVQKKSEPPKLSVTFLHTPAHFPTARYRPGGGLPHVARGCADAAKAAGGAVAEGTRSRAPVCVRVRCALSHPRPHPMFILSIIIIKCVPWSVSWSVPQSVSLAVSLMPRKRPVYRALAVSLAVSLAVPQTVPQDVPLPCRAPRRRASAAESAASAIGGGARRRASAAASAAHAAGLADGRRPRHLGAGGAVAGGGWRLRSRGGAEPSTQGLPG